MPSHFIGGQQQIDEMPQLTDVPTSAVPTNILSPLISDIHIMLIVGTIIVVGIFAFIFLRRKKK